MNDAEDKEPNPERDVSAGDEDVRATMDLTRQALDASMAEIERSKRLLRETQELAEPPVPPEPDGADDENRSR